jgi:hypothetical protein
MKVVFSNQPSLTGAPPWSRGELRSAQPFVCSCCRPNSPSASCTVANRASELGILESGSLSLIDYDV